MMGSEWPSRDLLSQQAATTPDTTAVVDAETGDEWTYAEFDARVDTVTERLETVVSGHTDRLGVLIDTRVAFVDVYFAAMRRNVTVVPLNVREHTAELQQKVDRVDLDALACSAQTEATAIEVADCPVLSVDSPTHEEVLSLQPIADATVSPIDPDPERTHLLMFTSGSAGEPKAVRLTLRNLIASATASAFRLGVTPSDRWLCCLPPYHMGGLAPIVRSALYGTTVVVQREFDPDATARAIDEHDVTGVSLVPTMLVRLLDAGWQPPASLRFVLLGGAPASEALIERCQRRGVPVRPTYGMTETASQIATTRPGDAFDYPGTVGQPLSCTDVMIVDDDPVDRGETGEIVVSGPTVTPGYLDSDRTDASFGEYGFRTGDVGYRDADGRLWVTGRIDDQIITGGETVDPDTVAAVLRDHPAVTDAAVVGIDDPEWGQRVSALVVPDDSGGEADRLDRDAILAHCDDRLARFKQPKTIGVASELPRTASGTVDRSAVRDRLLETGTDGSGSST